LLGRCCSDNFKRPKNLQPVGRSKNTKGCGPLAGDDVMANS
jgi:hypothetical protein